MKRMFAAAVFLAALGMLIKLAWKEPRAPRIVDDSVPIAADPRGVADRDAAILAKYPQNRALVSRVLRRYRRNAWAIERTDGLRGLTLLDKLDLEAVHLYERYPSEFRRLRDCLTDDAAADLILHWREYFALKHAEDSDRSILIGEIARLTPSQRRLASRWPNALPFFLVDAEGTAELIRRYSNDEKTLRDALIILDFIDLRPGATDFRRALQTLDRHGQLAVDAFRLQGLDGFALAAERGAVLEALGDALPLEQALILLKVNDEDVGEMLRTRSAESVAGSLRHVGAAGLTAEVGGSPHGLRLTVDYGERGERALAKAGADAADLVFDEFADSTLRNQAVEALAEHGPTAAAILSKYAADADFRDVLRRYGAPAIAPIARADMAPGVLSSLRAKPNRSFRETLSIGILALSKENGQAAIAAIKKDGLDRVASLNDADVEFYQFLPLYDLIHLGRVLGRGQSPTSGEMTWALVDGCFVVADVLSLASIQPEGVAASEAARSEIKSAARQAAKSLGREAGEEALRVGEKAAARQGTEIAAERLSKWWTVRLAGGPYQVLRRFPDALEKLGVADIARLGQPLCAKAGFRLSPWKPLRFLSSKVLEIPPRKGLKYLGVQALQATVGVVAFHKMEEHLASRRPVEPETETATKTESVSEPHD